MKVRVALMKIAPSDVVFITAFIEQPGKDARATIALQHGVTAADVRIHVIGTLDTDGLDAGVKWPIGVFAPLLRHQQREPPLRWWQRRRSA